MIAPAIRDPVQWRVATRRHDWLDGAVLSDLLGRWTEASLIGRPGRLETADGQQSWPLVSGQSLADAVLRAPRDGDGGLWCRMRGEQPLPWSMSVVLSGFSPGLDRTIGYSMINLDLPRQHCEAMDGRLLDLFGRMHRPGNCEYASIHPEHHASLLRLRAYVPALDVAPLFAGLLWANFLGPGTVEKFEKAAIDRLDVARRRWFGGRGVFLAVSEDLGSIDSPACERKLIALTEEMRSAAR